MFTTNSQNMAAERRASSRSTDELSAALMSASSGQYLVQRPDNMTSDDAAFSHPLPKSLRSQAATQQIQPETYPNGSILTDDNQIGAEYAVSQSDFDQLRVPIQEWAAMDMDFGMVPSDQEGGLLEHEWSMLGSSHLTNANLIEGRW